MSETKTRGAGLTRAVGTLATRGASLNGMSCLLELRHRRLDQESNVESTASETLRFSEIKDALVREGFTEEEVVLVLADAIRSADISFNEYWELVIPAEARQLGARTIA